MKQRSMGKHCKRIGVTFIVMATIFLGMGQANAIPIVSTLGNSIGDYNKGLTVGQAFTTGQPITIGTAEFLFGGGWTPTAGAYLTIQNNVLDINGDGIPGSTVHDTWNTHSTSGNIVTYSGNYTLSAGTTYWLVLHDSVSQKIAYTAYDLSTSLVMNYGASLPERYNNFETPNPPNITYWTIEDGPTIFAVNPVPIPGAVWLLGSGLIGLVGIGRKRLRK